MKPILILLALLLARLSLQAHEGAKHQASQAAKAAAAAATATAKELPGEVAGAAQAAQKIDWRAVLKASVFNHKHNKLVHFPLALGVVGLIFLALSGRFESLRSGGRWMVFIAALTAVAAVLTGKAQEDDIEGAALRQVVEVHEALGISGMLGLWGAWVLSFFESARKWSWAYDLLLAGAVLATGALGGILSHMQL